MQIELPGIRGARGGFGGGRGAAQPRVEAPALLAELKTGRIYAALDVFDQEPLPDDNPFRDLDNVILTPHIAGLTLECGIRVSVEAVKAFLDVCHGRKPEGIANPEVLTQPRWHKRFSS